MRSGSSIGHSAPADCAAIYTTDWSGAFAPDYVLNPAWSTAEGAPALYGTGDATALPVLQETSQLACGWLPPDGGDGTVDYLTRTTTVYDDRGDAISSVTEIDQNGDGVIDYTETRTRTVS